MFFDRTDGNSVFSQSGNPPNSSSTTVRWAQLQNLSGGLAAQGVPQVIVYRCDNDNLPSSAQWNVGVQMAIPWAQTLDVSRGIPGGSGLPTELLRLAGRS